MSGVNTNRWEKTTATTGAAMWALLAGLAGAGRAPLGVIELLFLFAPLVVFPLGLALGRRIAPPRYATLESAVRLVQPFAAASSVISFWISPGYLAGALVVPWFFISAALGLAGVSTLLRGRDHALWQWAIWVGRMDLVVAAAWLLASRLGLRPLGIQEPIILLTAVHFHYTGFAGATIAGALSINSQLQPATRRPAAITTLLVLAVPFALAAGFVWSTALKFAAALLLTLSVVGVAGLQLWLARSIASRVGRFFLRLSASAVILGMALAAIYAFGEWLKRDWLLIPRMASTHGLLNTLGFTLFGLLGWLVALSEADDPTA